MSHLALDDPLALKKILMECHVPTPIVAHLEVLGYKSVALLGFAVPSESQFDELIEKIIPKDLGEPVDLLSPGAASLRRVIRQCFDACSSQGGLTREPQAAAMPKPKLTLAEYKELKIKFHEFFPGELLTPESTPSFMFVANLKEQFDTGTWTCGDTEFQSRPRFCFRRIASPDQISNFYSACSISRTCWIFRKPLFQQEGQWNQCCCVSKLSWQMP